MIKQVLQNRIISLETENKKLLESNLALVIEIDKLKETIKVLKNKLSKYDKS